MYMSLPTWLQALLFSAITFFVPVVPAIILVGAFIIVDTVSGIWAAMKRGDEITSRRLGSVITKSILYLSTLLLGYGVDQVLLAGSGIIVNVDNIVTKLVLMAIIFIESKSIDENFYSITGTSMLVSAKKALTRALKIKNDVSGL